jgi:hypothetical protein
MTDVALVLVEFGRHGERDALDLLLAAVRRAFPRSRAGAVVVDNADEGEGETAIASDIYRIAGDNSLHEFSGWDRGLAWLERRTPLATDTIVVLANDTVARVDKRQHVCELPVDRLAAVRHGALVGWVDEYPQPIELFGYSVRQWVDTSLVVAERRTFATLGPLADPLAAGSVFTNDWRNPFLEPSPLSARYRQYLATYYFGAPAAGGFDQAWYASEPLNARNFGVFKAKLRSVFCEHLLSGRARAARVPLVHTRLTPLTIDPV